jgi:hypothetical protein
MSKRIFLNNLGTTFPDWFSERKGTEVHIWKDVAISTKKKGKSKTPCSTVRILLVTSYPPTFSVETIYLSDESGEEVSRGRPKRTESSADAKIKALELIEKLS